MQINNPMQFLMAVRSGQNPMQMLTQMLEQSAGNTPMGQNILSLMQKGDRGGIEMLARNLCAQRGLDFDKEFSNFKQQLGVK